MKKSIFIILCLWCGVSFAQQEDSTYTKIVNGAQAAYRNKEYKKSLQLYLDAVAHPASKIWRGGLLYNVSCDYSLLGNTKDALKYLQQAIDSGYTDYRWMSKDTDFENLKKKNKKQFQALIDKAKILDKNQRLVKSPIAVVEYDNYTGPADISKHIWDDFNNPQMDSLRKKYQLYKIIEQGQTEWDKIKLMLDFVANKFEHHSSHGCDTMNALGIFAGAERGEKYRCVEYGIALANCLTAVGYPARVVGLQREGVAYGDSKGHVCAEVWSNQFQKWILLDGQNDAWWELNGQPLNSEECRKLFTSGQVEKMKFVGQHKNYNYSSIQPSWDVYFYHLTFSYQNTFFVNAKGNTIFEFLSCSVTPELFFQAWPYNKEFITDCNEAYPMLNQTPIHLMNVNTNVPSDTLSITLTHTMPFFKKFMVRIDSGEWKDSNDKFQWILKKGENTIEVKAVNLAGVEGKTSKIVLKNNIPALNK